MKVFLLIPLFFSVLSSVNGQEKTLSNSIVITGKVQFLNPDNFKHFNKVWLSKRQGWNNQFYDSADIAPDGTWKLTLDKDIPTLYNLDIAKWDRVTVFTDADMNINSRGYDTAKVKIKNPPYVFIEGSADNHFINLIDHASYRNYQTMIAAGKEIYYAGLSKDSSWSIYLKSVDPYRQLNEDFRERLLLLINIYKDRPVVLYGLSKLNWENDQETILPILNGLRQKYPWFKDVEEMQRSMEAKIAASNLLKPGMPIPVINYPNDKGITQAFKQYEGKYLLIDFWASWCGPCRASVPKVKKLYSTYKDKGFEVVSISIDDNKKAWEKAMIEENMPWQQWLSPDKNETMQKFLFSGIPTLYLVDRQGKIVARYTGYNENMEKKIAEIFLKDKS